MQPPPIQNVTLTVEAAKHGSDPIVWEMTHGTNKGGPGHYPVVTVQPNAKAEFTVTINNPGTTTFSSDPIWIQKGTVKPTQHVIHGIKVNSGAGTTVLKFTDGNKDPGTLTYVLNFANVPQGTPTKLDPIIENQGGGPGMMGGPDYTAYYIGGAVLLAALALFLIYRSWSSRPQRAEMERPAAEPPEMQRPTDTTDI